MSNLRISYEVYLDCVRRATQLERERDLAIAAQRTLRQEFLHIYRRQELDFAELEKRVEKLECELRKERQVWLDRLGSIDDQLNICLSKLESKVQQETEDVDDES